MPDCCSLVGRSLYDHIVGDFLSASLLKLCVYADTSYYVMSKEADILKVSLGP